MFWIMQAMDRFWAWLDWLLDSGERPFLVTLESEKGWRWQVEVLATNHEVARLLVGEEYPRDRVVEVQQLNF